MCVLIHMHEINQNRLINGCHFAFTINWILQLEAEITFHLATSWVMIWNTNVTALVCTNNFNFIIVNISMWEICVSVKNIYFEHNVLHIVNKCHLKITNTVSVLFNNKCNLSCVCGITDGSCRGGYQQTASKAQITDDERLHWIDLSARKIITASGKVSLTANRKFPHDWILTKCLYIAV